MDVDEAEQAAALWPSKPGLPRGCILHLGQLLHPSGATRYEVDARIAQARTAWMSLRSLWPTGAVPIRWKARVYSAVVFSRLTSGLIALVLDDSDLRRLETVHAKWARAMLASSSAATQRGSTNEDVLREARLYTVGSQLRVQRLKWLRQMMSNPLDHVATLAAVAGHPPGTPGPLLPSGWPCSAASAYLRLFSEDLVQWARICLLFTSYAADDL